jgi:hypothetical protein
VGGMAEIQSTMASFIVNWLRQLVGILILISFQAILTSFQAILTWSSNINITF